MNDKAVLLIVDDSPSNIQALAECLKDDYRLKVATSGERCLELTQSSEKPDLILLDVVMPEMDGYEVLAKLKITPETSEIPVVFVTSKSEEAEEEKGLALGAVDYITKPIRPAIVKARVKTQIKLKEQRDQLRKLAMRDQLTDLYNRRYLLESASQKLSLAYRHKIPLSILLVDVDHFKSINDECGHAIGDEVLQAIAKMLNHTCRNEDIVARIGGEEFVALLDRCDIEYAKLKAESLRQNIEGLRPNSRLVTVSVGIAAIDVSGDNEDVEALLKRADKALYEAKTQGRNRVAIGETAPAL